MRTLTALFLRHLKLGYGLRTSLRLARWCMDPSQPLTKDRHVR